MGLHIFHHIAVHALGGAPERQFAQGRDIAGREEMAERTLSLGFHIDFAFPQPPQQLLGSGVHQLDLVGFVQNLVRHGLAHMDAGDLGDHVIEAFDVLDIHGGEDVDARCQNLLDIEIALGVAAAFRVGVGQLIHQNQSGMPLQNSVQVHLGDDMAFVE